MTLKKKYQPLIVLGIVAAYYVWKQSQNGDASGYLGTRTTQVIKDFIAQLQPIADKVQAETGIDAILGMGQAAHESAWGTSQLSRPDASLAILPSDSQGPANNLFGFTAEPGTYWRTQNLPYVEMPTHEWIKQPDGSTKQIATTRPFRAYDSWEASYRDWARLMQTAHYVQAGVLDALKAGDVDALGAALNKAAYATDPNYGSKVAAVIGQIEDNLA